jgi:hypothetical protein
MKIGKRGRGRTGNSVLKRGEETRRQVVRIRRPVASSISDASSPVHGAFYFIYSDLLDGSVGTSHCMA